MTMKTTTTTPVRIKTTMGRPQMPNKADIPTIEPKKLEKRPLMEDITIPKTEIAEEIIFSTKLSADDNSSPWNQVEAAPTVC